MTDKFANAAYRESGTTVIIGGGAIGTALAEQYRGHGPCYQLRRQSANSTMQHQQIIADVTDTASLQHAAAQITTPITRLFYTVGILHEHDSATPRSAKPEKSLKQIDPAWMAKSFAVNTIGFANVMQCLQPAFARKQRLFIAALSARVGSIADNSSGGWYSYRASKAALNMLVRGSAVELARWNPESIVVALHPGTVASKLSEPFVTMRTPYTIHSPQDCAANLYTVAEGLDASHSGAFFDWEGKTIPW